MDAALILKVAGIGLTVSIAYQLLSKYGRDEQAVLVSLAGIIIVMLMLTEQLGRHGAAEEARHIAYYEARIGAMAQTARSELAAKARLCRALGALAGVMIAVLLL